MSGRGRHASECPGTLAASAGTWGPRAGDRSGSEGNGGDKDFPPLCPGQHEAAEQRLGAGPYCLYWKAISAIIFLRWRYAWSEKP